MPARIMSLALLAAGLLPSTLLAETRPIRDGAPASRTLRTRFTYKATVPAVPKGAKALDVWLPIPSDGPWQKIANLEVACPVPHRITTESRFGNRMVYARQTDPSRPLVVSVTFQVDRTEANPLKSNQTNGHSDGLAEYLRADARVPIGGRYAEIAKEVAGGKTTAIEKMRAVYDHTVANMQYDYKKESPKLGQGDVAFVCDYKKGNCSDLHSYVISLARSLNVPAYLEYGFPVTGIPVPAAVAKTGTVGGYHCWTWFYDEQRGWLPLDASDGRRWLDSGRPDIKDSLIGNLVVERSAVAFSRGRDIVLEPAQKSGPLNDFIYPYAEADGEPVPATWELAYELLSPAGVLALPAGDLASQVADLRKLVLDQQVEIARLRANQEAKAPLDPAKPSLPVATASKEKVSVYGFVRTDVISDSQAPNPNSQTPFYIESPDNPGFSSGDRRFSMHPRLTRLGFNFAETGQSIKGWDVSGKLEIDFQGGGPESRANPRFRHAYAQLKRGDMALLIGQTWDLISPLFPSPNDDTLMWNAGNLGDRRAQVRYTHDRKGDPITFAVGLGLSGAVDSKDLDMNGVRDGEASGAPNIQARLAWRSRNATVGVWGHSARERTSAAVGGERKFYGRSLGIDAALALSTAIDLRGELWEGENLSDFRGGIGQGVNVTTGREVESKGGWIELGIATSPRHRLAFGGTVDDPKDSDLSANARTKNSSAYVHNRWSLSPSVDLGLNFLSWSTDYKGRRRGKDSRFNLYLTYKY